MKDTFFEGRVTANRTIDEPGVGADDSTTTERTPTLMVPNYVGGFCVDDNPEAPTACRPEKLPLVTLLFDTLYEKMPFPPLPRM